LYLWDVVGVGSRRLGCETLSWKRLAADLRGGGGGNCLLHWLLRQRGRTCWLVLAYTVGNVGFLGLYQGPGVLQSCCSRQFAGVSSWWCHPMIVRSQWLCLLHLSCCADGFMVVCWYDHKAGDFHTVLHQLEPLSQSLLP
jgi:hypothetical protein